LRKWDRHAEIFFARNVLLKEWQEKYELLGGLLSVGELEGAEEEAGERYLFSQKA